MELNSFKSKPPKHGFTSVKEVPETSVVKLTVFWKMKKIFKWRLSLKDTNRTFWPSMSISPSSFKKAKKKEKRVAGQTRGCERQSKGSRVKCRCKWFASTSSQDSVLTRGHSSPVEGFWAHLGDAGLEKGCLGHKAYFSVVICPGRLALMFLKVSPHCFCFVFLSCPWRFHSLS